MAVLPTGIGPVTGGYQIERSLRFNSADSAYLNRTPASAGNRQKWTLNCWFKLSALNQDNAIFSAGNTTYYTTIRVDSNNELVFYIDDSAAYSLFTTQLFRDVSAWYNLTIAFDTTQATASNRVKIYINGSQITAFRSSSYPVQNYSGQINNNVAHAIGRRDASASQYFSGYQTETYFIDGQALTPSDFGETDSATGVWKPKAFSGTYGTNGFYLKFADNSGTTSTTLGKDSSGNGNNWTPNNFSVTAGAGNDSMVDSPTAYGTDTGVGGTVRGNYCTLNPNDKNSGITLTNGNLDASMPTQLQNVYGTLSVTSGKWYWETTINSLSGRVIIGVGNTVDQNWNLDPSSSSALWGYYSVNGNKLNGSNTAYGNSFTANDVIGVAVDMDSGKIWFSKNGTWQASGDPAAGTNAAFTNLSGSVRPMYNQQLTNAVTLSCNFGQRAFAYTAPSGFKALCTQNLPTPTIGATSTTQANDYFNVVTFSGNGSAGSVTGVGFQPDFIWAKNRTNAYNHELWDAIRGVNSTLFSNSTAAQDTTANRLVSFNSDGFSYGTSSNLYVNATNSVAWNWKANGAGSTNTAGTITSTVSASTTSGFSIVTYVGTNAIGATVGHGLGAAPAMIIIKNRSSAEAWPVYHRSVGATKYLVLNTTAAEATATTPWNNTAPTSTVFTIANWNALNENGSNHVAYCFAPVAGYSAFGSYTGNGSTDGPFVYLGFRARYVLVKNIGATGWWTIYDTARDPANDGDMEILAAQSSSAGGNQLSSPFDIVSNGFKVRSGSTSSDNNSSGVSYIYAAFAESPFKYALAR